MEESTVDGLSGGPQHDVKRIASSEDTDGPTAFRHELMQHYPPIESIGPLTSADSRQRRAVLEEAARQFTEQSWENALKAFRVTTGDAHLTQLNIGVGLVGTSMVRVVTSVETTETQPWMKNLKSPVAHASQPPNGDSALPQEVVQRVLDAIAADDRSPSHGMTAAPRLIQELIKPHEAAFRAMYLHECGLDRLTEEHHERYLEVLTATCATWRPAA